MHRVVFLFNNPGLRVWLFIRECILCRISRLNGVQEAGGSNPLTQTTKNRPLFLWNMQKAGGFSVPPRAAGLSLLGFHRHITHYLAYKIAWGVVSLTTQPGVDSGPWSVIECGRVIEPMVPAVWRSRRSSLRRWRLQPFLVCCRSCVYSLPRSIRVPILLKAASALSLCQPM